MMNRDQALDNLWLARALFELGAVHFGDFTHGETAVNSPVFVNPKRLIGNPMALGVAAKLMYQEVMLAQSLRRSKVQLYDVVAGVPVGGLLLATAFSLESTTPLIYPRMQPQGTGQPGIEGQYRPDSRALLVDDLVTGGSSVIEAARFLSAHGVTVKDAVILIDRDQGAQARLKHMGINLISILKLDVMMNLYHSNGWIEEEQYNRYLRYASANHPAHEHPPALTPAEQAQAEDGDEDGES
ncbi:MAG: orotate phosphoribosyltransferase [Ktedonobacterales bacterium]